MKNELIRFCLAFIMGAIFATHIISYFATYTPKSLISVIIDLCLLGYTVYRLQGE